MFNTFILLTYHIRMALKNDYRDRFTAFRSFLYNKDVTGLISLAFKTFLCCKILKICYDLLLMT